MHHSTFVHLKSTKRVLRYVAGSPDQGILPLINQVFNSKHYVTMTWQVASPQKDPLQGIACCWEPLLSYRNPKGGVWCQGIVLNQNTGP